MAVSRMEEKNSLSQKRGSEAVERDVVADLKTRQITVGIQLEGIVCPENRRRYPPGNELVINPDHICTLVEEYDPNRKLHPQRVHPHDRKTARRSEEQARIRIQSISPEQPADLTRSAV